MSPWAIFSALPALEIFKTKTLLRLFPVSFLMTFFLLLLLRKQVSQKLGSVEILRSTRLNIYSRILELKMWRGNKIVLRYHKELDRPKEIMQKCGFEKHTNFLAWNI